MNRKNRRLLSNLQRVWVWHSGNIERVIEFSKVTAREKLRSIEILFNPNQPSAGERRKSFEVAINRQQLKEFKRLNTWIHGGNRELRRAIREMTRVHQRQYFRNYEILKCLLGEARKYKKRFLKNKLLKKLSGFRTEIQKDFRHYRKARSFELKILIKDMEKAIKQINKSVFIDNLKSYIDSFEDFFVLEETIFRRLVDRSINRIHQQNKEIIAQHMTEENEGEMRLDPPSWNMFIDAE